MDKTTGSAKKMLLYVSFINWNVYKKKKYEGGTF